MIILLSTIAVIYVAMQPVIQFLIPYAHIHHFVTEYFNPVRNQIPWRLHDIGIGHVCEIISIQMGRMMREVCTSNLFCHSHGNGNLYRADDRTKWTVRREISDNGPRRPGGDTLTRISQAVEGTVPETKVIPKKSKGSDLFSGLFVPRPPNSSFDSIVCGLLPRAGTLGFGLQINRTSFRFNTKK